MGGGGGLIEDLRYFAFSFESLSLQVTLNTSPIAVALYILGAVQCLRCVKWKAWSYIGRGLVR